MEQDRGGDVEGGAGTIERVFGNEKR